MEGKVYTNKKYNCEICGKMYDELKDRIECETKCFKQQAENAKKAAEAKKKEEKMASEAKVTAAFDAAYKLRDEHVAKYGSYFYKPPVTNQAANIHYPTLNDVFNFILMEE